MAKTNFNVFFMLKIIIAICTSYILAVIFLRFCQGNSNFKKRKKKNSQFKVFYTNNEIHNK